MKRLLLAVVVVGLMSTGAMALDGTISKVIVKSDGVVKVVLEKTSGGPFARTIACDTMDADKAMLAVALTAQSTGATIEAYADSTRWTYMSIIPTP